MSEPKRYNIHNWAGWSTSAEPIGGNDREDDTLKELLTRVDIMGPSPLEHRREEIINLARELGELCAEKNEAYGSSFETCGEAMRLLYPEGIPPEKMEDALIIARIWDKLGRIATNQDAFGEDPYRDVAGYGILGALRSVW